MRYIKLFESFSGEEDIKWAVISVFDTPSEAMNIEKGVEGLYMIDLGMDEKVDVDSDQWRAFEAMVDEKFPGSKCHLYSKNFAGRTFIIDRYAFNISILVMPPNMLDLLKEDMASMEERANEHGDEWFRIGEGGDALTVRMSMESGQEASDKMCEVEIAHHSTYGGYSITELYDDDESEILDEIYNKIKGYIIDTDLYDFVNYHGNVVFEAGDDAIKKAMDDLIDDKQNFYLDISVI